jgi:hypothetical protein
MHLVPEKSGIAVARVENVEELLEGEHQEIDCYGYGRIQLQQSKSE